VRARRIDDSVDVGCAESRVDVDAEHGLCFRIMVANVEYGLTWPPVLSQAPARERTRSFANVTLVIPPADAERVELEQLSRVILVRTTGGARPPVEEDEHRRTRRDGRDEVAEVAERVAPNHVAIVKKKQASTALLLAIDVEVIGPELDHALEELPFAVDGPENSPPAKLGERLVLREREEVLHWEAYRLDATQAVMCSAVVDRVRGELALEVLVEAERRYVAHVAGTRSVGHATQDTKCV
jgi:hypothetical protein